MKTATASTTTLDARERVRGTGKKIAMKKKKKMTRVATRTTPPRAFSGARGDEGTVGEIALADVSRGKKIGRGSCGDVYEGSKGSRRVGLKESRGGGGESNESEAANNRRGRG
jgi:hypothetical protein